MPKISSAEFQRNLGLYPDKALSEPVTIPKTAASGWCCCRWMNTTG
jgi:hypothetical protein